MDIQIQKTKLTPHTEDALCRIFQEAFPDSRWNESVPFIDDDIITATKNGSIVGFCFIHDKPPYAFPGNETGMFLYNFCVDVDFQCSGVGTAILTYVVSQYPKIYCHVDADNLSHQKWIETRGWKKIGNFRNRLIEYKYVGINNKDDDADFTVNVCGETPYYDSDENIIYLSTI